MRLCGHYSDSQDTLHPISPQNYYFSPICFLRGARLAGEAELSGLCRKPLSHPAPTHRHPTEEVPDAQHKGRLREAVLLPPRTTSGQRAEQYWSIALTTTGRSADQ